MNTLMLLGHVRLYWINMEYMLFLVSTIVMWSRFPASVPRSLHQLCERISLTVDDDLSHTVIINSAHR
jgi:hypothetical protein